MIANSLVELDRAHLLHPAVSPRQHGHQGVTVPGSGRLLERGRRMGALLQSELHARFDAHPLVGDVRGRGRLAALELVADRHRRTRLPAALGVGDRLAALGTRHGRIFRAFADGTVGLAPPLCCTQDDVAALLDRPEATLAGLMDATDLRQALAA